jgi:16S rRNA (guanine527-N7)-methyltransferase
MDIFQKQLVTSAQTAGIFLEKSLMVTLIRHWHLLSEANTRFNLTAIRDPEIAAEKHYVDCLIAGSAITARLNAGGTIADLGSGGGFPGLVMAAVRPEFAYTLIESAQKKAAFLNDCVAAMNLTEVKVLSCWAEAVGHDPLFRGCFSAVVARAVSELAVLAEYALPLLANNGLFFAMKGPAPDDELRAAATALDLLGGTAEDVIHYALPILGEKRSMIVIRKTAATPDKYPRRPGIPIKRPL